MIIRQLSICTILTAALFAAIVSPHLHADETGSITSPGLQSVFGQRARVIPMVENAPEINGNYWKEPWLSLPEYRFQFANPEIPGFVKKGPHVKLAADDKQLYIIFQVREIHGGKVKQDDTAALLHDAHVGTALIVNGKRLYIAVNPAGKICHAELNAEGAIDTSWNPEGVTHSSIRANGFWFVEISIPVDELRKTAGKLPRIWRANFICKTWADPSKPRRNRSWFNNHLAWKSSLKVADFIYTKESTGVLFYPRGEAGTDAETLIKASTDARKAAVEKEKAETERREKIHDGFSFSLNQLKAVYPHSPVKLVPRVDKPPVLDGDPGDPAWKEADLLNPEKPLVFFDGFIPGVPQINRTFAKIVTDDQYLYVLYICEETQIKKIVTGDGALWSHDLCDLLLDIGRQRDQASSAYRILEINAAARTDVKRGDQLPWKPKSFTAKTKIYKDKWVIEMKVSFKDLGISDKNFPIIWGANFLRYRAADRQGFDDPDTPNTEFAWRSNLLGYPHVPNRFGILCFEKGNAVPGESLAKYPDKKGKLNVYTLADQTPIPFKPPVKKEASFGEKPKVSVKDGKAVITFAVTRSVDAAVDVTDSSGKIIAHLASGLLGANAPKPFVNGLAQKLEWDFTDDYGNKLPSAEYQVRVRLGLQAEFEKVLLGDPNKLSKINAFTVDKDGTLYIITEDKTYGHYHVFNIKAFDRSGRFVRHVMPFPATLPANKLEGVEPIQLTDKKWMPVMYHPLLHIYIPQLGAVQAQQPVITRDGKLLLKNYMIETLSMMPSRLIKLGTDGSVSKDYTGPLLGKDLYSGIHSMALSPDDKVVYITGVRGISRWNGAAHHAVYRVGLSDKSITMDNGHPKPFIGRYMVPGGGQNQLNRPADISVDAKGDIYVADTGNNRIAVFKPDGTYLTELSVKSPLDVEVHPATGAIYVMSQSREGPSILKFTDITHKEAAASLRIRREKRCNSMMCLDATAKPASLYFLTAATSLNKVVDKGDRLENMGDIVAAHRKDKNKGNYINALTTFEISHDGKYFQVGKVAAFGYTFQEVFDVADGNRFTKEFKQYIAGRDGKLYHIRNHVLSRYNADLSPAPFEKTKTIKLPKNAPHITIDCSGNVYAAPPNSVYKYGPDGKLMNKHFIQMVMPGKSGAAVPNLDTDWDGNIYIGGSLKRPGNVIPRFFRGRIPQNHGISPGPQLTYENYYGSVIKYGSEGGKIRSEDNGDLLIGYGYHGYKHARATGVEWFYMGTSPLNYRRYGHGRCNCEHGRFTIDRYDRIFMPDALRYSVQVIDKNKNELLRFGEYGNANSCLPNSPGTEPKIGFAWPLCVRVSEDVCLVSDKVNHRILKIRLTYITEKSIDCKKP